LGETPNNFDLVVTSYPVSEETFERVIDDVFKRFLPNSVAILSGDQAIPVERLGRKFENSFTDNARLWRPDGDRGISTTIRKFKGLDAQVVILTDLPADLDSSLLYTGISRAVERLIVLCPKPTVDELFRRMNDPRPF
jgi:superfamily I DNA/RNA helicase